VHYVVDESNRIVGVDEGWDTSATEQAQPGAAPTGDKIIGRPLVEFLAGDATKMFVRAALDAARLLGESRRLPYRCDGPHERRRFEMVISPLADGHVKVEHILVEAFPRIARHSRARLAVSAGWRCSQCLSVRLVGSTVWGDSNLDSSAPLAYDVCPSCARRLFESGPSGRPVLGD
jgi:hypothetical protein